SASRRIRWQKFFGGNGQKRSKLVACGGREVSPSPGRGREWGVKTLRVREGEVHRRPAGPALAGRSTATLVTLFSSPPRATVRFPASASWFSDNRGQERQYWRSCSSQGWPASGLQERQCPFSSPRRLGIRYPRVSTSGLSTHSPQRTTTAKKTYHSDCCAK